MTSVYLSKYVVAVRDGKQDFKPEDIYNHLESATKGVSIRLLPERRYNPLKES